MQYTENGVLLTFEEYADYQKLLAAFAALRPETTISTAEVEP